jgi:thymidylate kinase
MWAIIEGPDGAGKTSLANAVAELINAEITHLGPPESPEQALDAVIGGPFATYAPGEGVEIVSDRHHWGDPVYGPIKRPEHDVDGFGEIGRAGWRYAELFAASRGAATILVEVDPHVAKMRIADRGDDYVDATHVDDIIARYDWLARGSLTIAARLQLNQPQDHDVYAEAVAQWARKREFEATPLGKYKHYVGSPRPRLLVVMPPDRAARLRVVNSFDEDEWQHVGIASTAMTAQAFEEMREVLDRPAICGFDKVPGHLEQVIAARDGSFTRDVSEIPKFMPA